MARQQNWTLRGLSTQNLEITHDVTVVLPLRISMI
jgi:hypothetical protein